MEFPNLLQFDRFAYDTETTGLSPMAGDRVFGFSISTPDNRDYYWDIRRTPKAVDWFNDQMRHYLGKVICHNQSFDYRMSHATGLKFDLGQTYDTVMMASLVNEFEHSYALDYLSRKYCKNTKSGQELYEQLAKLFGGRATKNVQISRIPDAPYEVVAPYAMDDTRATLDLFDYLWNEIEKQDLHKILEFERSVAPVIIASEMHGVRVDTLQAERAVGVLTPEIKQLQKKLDDVAGFKCNPQPSKDITKLFEPKWKDGRWWANDGTPLAETHAGKASLGADAMREMSHPAAEIILELRSLIKTRDTFLVGHVLESAQSGRVYPGINQTKSDDGGGTGTGRLSYQGPALQQIPDRNKKVAEVVKSVFLPDEGHSWVDGDMASFEVRIFGHLIGTPDIVQAYANNPETDFHQYVADETGLPRNATYSGEANAKQLNLSMIFNQGNGTTAEKMGMLWSWESFIPADSRDGKEVVYKKAGSEAMEIIDRYHQKLPGVKKLADGCKKTAEKRGYIFTRYGRHLRFPNGWKSYKASGILIQATSADENKKNWLLIDEALKDTGAKMLLNTHDSYSMSIPIGEEERIAKMVKANVERERGLRVPLILEINKPGRTWWESKASKRWM